jgi:hypothetical protein
MSGGFGNCCPGLADRAGPVARLLARRRQSAGLPASGLACSGAWPARGTGVETGVRYLLEKAGMKAEDATFVAIGAPTAAFAALTNNGCAHRFFCCDFLVSCKEDQCMTPA